LFLVACADLHMLSDQLSLQGPPGQMAYVHFEDMTEVIVSTELALRPEKLVAFLVRATLQQQTTYMHNQARSPSKAASGSGATQLEMTASQHGYESVYHGDTHTVASAGCASQGPHASIESGEQTPLMPSRHGSSTALVDAAPNQLTASRDALRVAKLAVLILEEQVTALEREEASTAHGSSQGGSETSA
jgi:hypothetical protein